jgi:hypothetical protein
LDREEESKELASLSKVNKVEDELLRLESRVYSLEKEAELISNLLLAAVLIGGYFLYQWYVVKMNGHIPGVTTE